MTKSQLRIKQVSLLTHYIKRYKQQNELWETVRLTSFLKNWDCDPFQSSSSLFICAFFFIIPSLNVLSPYFNMSINLVSALTVWILINFMKQLLQLLLPLQTITGQLPPPPPPPPRSCTSFLTTKLIILVWQIALTYQSWINTPCDSNSPGQTEVVLCE